MSEGTFPDIAVHLKLLEKQKSLKNANFLRLKHKRSGPSCSKLKKVVSYCDIRISILKYMYGKYIDIFC